VVLGDLKDFQWSAPIMTLQEGALTNLITLLPEHDRYTYNHEGNAQVLDHILGDLAFSKQIRHLMLCI
jgi:predicted extracellular nuclease